MAGNIFGKLYKLTSFGESHGKAIGGVIDGCPANIDLDFDYIQNELNRRKPGQSKITTQRKESDEVEFLSGIYYKKTLGTPIGFIVRNHDYKPEDYDKYRDVFRPSHADFTYQKKYGIRDYRGGGRTSARVTIPRVVAGAIAKLVLRKLGVQIYAFTSQVGEIVLPENYKDFDFSKIDDNIIRCPDAAIAEKMIRKVEEIKAEGETIGGIISCVVQNVPVGIGEPEFEKLHAELAKAILSINAVKGFQIGAGFESVKLKGSEHNDIFFIDGDRIRTKTNYSGGIQGGITNGEDIHFKAVFKPVATIMKEQKSINIDNEEITIQPKGRHDPCVLPRAVPIVESMTAMVILDYFLQNKTVNLL